ncbi:MAG TPA: hypothetical protein VMA13_00795 [Candidatus Saccharimonadales bacterium]|nr:hypothetical protein [Candidatus Saccharimonadales bacterium]
MGFLKYWKENFKTAEGWYSFVSFIISGVALLISFLCHTSDLQTPNEKIFTALSFIASILFLIMGIMWLPFSRHQADKKLHNAELSEAKEQIAVLQKKIEDDSFKLEIVSTLEVMNNKNRITALLKIQVVNNGRRPAKIRRAVMLGLFSKVAILGNPNLPILESSECEYVAHQEKVVVEISGDGGLHVWQVEILNHPHYKFVERDGERYAQGFIEFTNGSRQAFETHLPPEDILQKFGRWINPPHQL